MDMFGKWKELSKIIFRKSSRQVTLEPSAQTVGDPTVNIPDMAGTTQDMVLRTQSQILTNKSIDADTNTITNIENADIKALAAIDASKIADGSVSNAEFQRLDGVTSAIQTQIDSKVTGPGSATDNAFARFDGTTGKLVQNSTAALGDTGIATGLTIDGDDNTVQDLPETAIKTNVTNASKFFTRNASGVPESATKAVPTGAVVGTTDSQALSNKSAAGLVATDYIEFDTQGSDPASPAGAGDVRVYSKDKFLYTKDSDGTVTQVGAGSGGRNYLAQDFFGNSVGTVGSGNVSDTGNRSTGTMTAWQTTNSANISISSSATTPLRETGSFLTTGSGNAAAGTTFIESKGFNLDNVDLGKPVSVIFDVSGSTLASDWDVCVVRYNSSGTFQEKISIAGTASTGTPASALIPTGTTTFRGFFLPSNTQSDYYAIRWRRLANAVNIRFDSLQVGPFSYQVGYAGTDWIAFTPTGTFTTNTTYTGYYRRVGDSMEIQYNLTFAGAPNSVVCSVNLPSGFSIDTTKMADGTNKNFSLGTGNARDASSGDSFPLSMRYSNTTTILIIPMDVSGTAVRTNNDLNATNPFTIAVNDTIDVFTVRLPIAQWSSNVQLADRAVEEFASNTSSTDADDTTSFAYGPDGSAGIFGTTALTSERIKRVRFQTPILPTDQLVIQIKQSSTSQWVNVCDATYQSGVGAFQYQNGLGYGMGIDYVAINSTDIGVAFGRYRSASGATYGAAGSSWATSLTTATRWRVRKVSGGAAVGYPISSDNISAPVSPSQIMVSGGNGQGSTNTMIRRFTGTVSSTGSDITYADSATLGGTFTINRAGLYAITYADTISASGPADMGISINSNQLTTKINSITDANVVVAAKFPNATGLCVAATIRCAAGDVLRAHGDNGLTLATGTFNVRFIVTRVGP